MRKIILLACVALFFTTCKKPDTTLPIITLFGANPMSIAIGGTYVEPGYKAVDNTDGDITGAVYITKNINKDTVGSYTVKYKVTDASGNLATAVRIVNVVNSIAKREGNYSVVDVVKGNTNQIFTYNVTVTSSPTVNNTVLVSNFGKYNTSCTVRFVFNAAGNTITIPSQALVNAGTANAGSVAGNGTVNADSTTLNLAYIVNYTAGGSDTSNAVYTKIK